MKPLFVTTCTPTYKKAWIFDSLARLASCRVVALLDLPPFDPRPLPANVERLPWQPGGLEYQAGYFLDGLHPCDLHDEGVVILADADAVVQRDFDESELATLARLDENTFAMGYNLRPGQTGAEEHELLRPRQPLEETAAKLKAPADVLRHCRVYNTGLVAGRVCAWRRLRHLYECYYRCAGEVAPGLFALHSWPQYLICSLLYEQGFAVEELPYSVHSHGHLGLQPGCTVEGGRLLRGGRPVFFAHAVPGLAP